MKTKESAHHLIQECLLTFGSAGGTREDILARSGLGPASFYREIPQLVAEGIAEQVGNRYRLPMRFLHNYRFKLWHDADQLRQRPPWVRALVDQVVEQSQEHLGSDLLALWLTGSAAHGTQTESSDLDFLAITRRSNDFFPKIPHKVQFLTLTPPEFQRSLSRSDNFCLATLRYGLLLEDRGWARSFLDMPIDLQPRLTYLRESLQEQWHRALSARTARARSDEFQAVAAYANTLGRSLLNLFDELPAGKPELIQLLRFYYGESLCQRFQPLLELADRDTLDLGKSLSALEEISENLFRNAKRIESMHDFYFAHGPQFNIYCWGMLEELSRGKIASTTRATDAWLKTGGGETLLLEAKSIAGSDFSENLMRFGWNLESEKSPFDRAIFLGNPQNKTSPILRSWNLQSADSRIQLVSSRDLLTAYLGWVMLGQRVDWLEPAPTRLSVYPKN